MEERGKYVTQLLWGKLRTPPQEAHLLFIILVVVSDRSQLEIILVVISCFSNLRLSPGKLLKNQTEISFAKILRKAQKIYPGSHLEYF